MSAEFIWGRLYRRQMITVTTATGHVFWHDALVPASKPLIHKGRKP